MSTVITSGKVIGNPDSSGWAQAYEFKPEDPFKLSSHGQLFAVVATNNQGAGIERIVEGREILTRLHEEYFGETGKSAFEALRKGVEKVAAQFRQENVEISAACLLGEYLYIAACGGSRILLLREGNLITLIESTESDVTSASGRSRVDDFLILSTGSFHNLLARGILKASFEGKNPVEAAEALAPHIHALPEEGAVGALFIKFEEGLKPKEEAFEISGDGTKVSPKTKLSSASLKFPELDSRVQKLAGFLKNIPQKKLYLSENLSDRSISQKKKVSLSVGVFLLVILVVSIFFGIRQKRKEKEEARYKEAVTVTRHQLEEAQSLTLLNPTRARELLVEAREKVLGLESMGVESPEVDLLRDEIKVNEEKILGEYNVTAETFVDLSLLSSNFKGDSIIESDGKVYILDALGRKIVAISIDSKRSEVVAGPAQIDVISGIAAYSDRVFFVNSEGVYEIDGGRNKVIESDWEGDVLTFAYTGNFYILDKGSSAIYRYGGTDSGFGSKKDWLASDGGINLSSSTSWVIDGSIWVLKEEGGILKFTLGNRENFALRGVFPAVSKPKAIYTNDELEYLYILDGGDSRVVVVDKGGEYKAQYRSEAIKDTFGMVVSEKEKKIILAREEELLSIDIKHL